MLGSGWKPGITGLRNWALANMVLLNSQRINSAFLIFVYENNNVGLSCGNVLVQGGTDGTLTGIELFDHALYLLAKASLVEVKAEDILA